MRATASAAARGHPSRWGRKSNAATAVPRAVPAPRPRAPHERPRPSAAVATRPLRRGKPPRSGSRAAVTIRTSPPLARARPSRDGPPATARPRRRRPRSRRRRCKSSCATRALRGAGGGRAAASIFKSRPQRRGRETLGRASPLRMHTGAAGAGAAAAPRNNLAAQLAWFAALDVSSSRRDEDRRDATDARSGLPRRTSRCNAPRLSARGSRTWPRSPRARRDPRAPSSCRRRWRRTRRRRRRPACGGSRWRRSSSRRSSGPSCRGRRTRRLRLERPLRRGRDLARRPLHRRSRRAPPLRTRRRRRLSSTDRRTERRNRRGPRLLTRPRSRTRGVRARAPASSLCPAPGPAAPRRATLRRRSLPRRRGSDRPPRRFRPAEDRPPRRRAAPPRSGAA